MINNIEEWLYSQIKATLPELSANIYPDLAEKGTPNPCAVYQLTEGNPFHVLDCGNSGIYSCSYQIRIYATRRSEANDMRDRLGAVMQSKCELGVEDAVIEAVEYAGLQNTYDKETKDYGAICAVMIHWKALNGAKT